MEGVVSHGGGQRVESLLVVAALLVAHEMRLVHVAADVEARFLVERLVLWLALDTLLQGRALRLLLLLMLVWKAVLWPNLVEGSLEHKLTHLQQNVRVLLLGLLGLLHGLLQRLAREGVLPQRVLLLEQEGLHLGSVVLVLVQGQFLQVLLAHQAVIRQ